MAEQEDYAPVDSVLEAWAKGHAVDWEQWSKGFAVRTFWLQGRVQIWLDSPDDEGYIVVHIAELKPSLPSKWGRRIDFRTPLDELQKCLDGVISKGQSWL